jgi:hypothetical protein
LKFGFGKVSDFFQYINPCLEFVVSGRGGGDDDTVGQVGVGDGDAKEMGTLPKQMQGYYERVLITKLLLSGAK